MYQFTFFSIVVARAFKWCMEYLTKLNSSPEELLRMLQTGNNIGHTKNQLRKHVESILDRFEVVKDAMMKYNKIFGGLHLFCKGMLLFQITALAYFPLQRMNAVPFPSLSIFVTMLIHDVIQVVVLLFEMGSVFKVSNKFKETWIWNLQKLSRCTRDTTDGEEDRNGLELLKLKGMLESCTPVGFEFGGCYIVTSNTILTVFSIVSTYLIIMMQLGI